MKQEDIVALAKAGFTREQIVALAGLQTAPVPQTAPVQQTASVQQTAQVQQPGTSGDPVLDALLGLREDMKKQALLFSSQPPTHQETTDDILASIINPKGENNGERFIF